MITVIFVAIILTVLTLGFLRLALNEQRIATDDDLTSRAFFASESGLEDVKRALDAYTKGDISLADLNAESCDSVSGFNPELSPDADYDIEYVCQLIDLTPSDLEFYLDGANQTFQFPINPVDADGNPVPSFPTELHVNWHLNADQSADGDGVVGPGQIEGVPVGAYLNLTDVTTWNSQRHPAMLRISIISFPTSAATFTRGDIEQYTVFASPVDGNVARPANNVNAGTNAGTIRPADCDSANPEYYCNVEFGNFSNNRQYYLRITSLYRPTHVQVTMSNGSGPNNARYFDKVQAVADVTGSSGGVLRRVEARIDLSRPTLMPDAAITSLDDICKDFFITDLAADFDGIPGTSCTTP